MRKIRVKLLDNNYTIHIGSGIGKDIQKFISTRIPANFCIILTNTTIHGIYRKRIQNIFKGVAHKVVILPDTEKIKSERHAFQIIRELIKYDNLHRKIFVSCFGGGVIGDLGGFVSSIYKRGIPYIQVPTTLLAQVDASIGGKTAIDVGGIKNSVGTFYQPRAVFADTRFLKTLSEREIKQGIAEIIKYGIIKDTSLFSYLENNHSRIMRLETAPMEKITYKCAKIKAAIVEKDEKERRGIRTILNFGHTIGHALEATMNFSRISHGEAVALGMLSATFISHKLGLCHKNTVQRIENIIQTYNLPRYIHFDFRKLARYLSHDKKFIGGSIRMVLVKNIGEVIVKSDIPTKLIQESLCYLKPHKVSVF